MNGFLKNIEKLTLENTDFRRVLYTTMKSQLVLMCLMPGEEIGNEEHGVDQFFRFEKGEGRVVLNSKDEFGVSDGTGLIIPGGTWHNIINTGKHPLKFYTIYSPAHHKDGIVHKTREEAMNDTEEFDGETTE